MRLGVDSCTVCGVPAHHYFHAAGGPYLVNGGVPFCEEHIPIGQGTYKYQTRALIEVDGNIGDV